MVVYRVLVPLEEGKSQLTRYVCSVNAKRVIYCISLRLVNMLNTSGKHWAFAGKVYNLPGLNCLQWFENVFDELPRDDQALFCIAIWWLWWEHNQITLGLKETPLNRLVELIVELKEREVHKAIEDGVMATVNQGPSWSPPTRPLVKLNVDAAVPEGFKHCTTGFIVHDDKGVVLMSGAVPIGDCLSVLHAELVSILRVWSWPFKQVSGV